MEGCCGAREQAGARSPNALAWRARDRSDDGMLAHLTPLEAPLLWVAFAAGVAVGALGMFVFKQRASRS